MVASSRANLFASAAAGVCALWGPLHGGANQAVLEMLEQIHAEGDDGSKFIAAAKSKDIAHGVFNGWTYVSVTVFIAGLVMLAIFRKPTAEQMVTAAA